MLWLFDDTLHTVVFILLIGFNLSKLHRRKLEETKFLNFGSHALVFSFWKENICVRIYRTPKAAVKWSSYKISLKDPECSRKRKRSCLLYFEYTTTGIMDKTSAWDDSAKSETQLQNIYISVPIVLVVRRRFLRDTVTRRVLGNCCSPSCELLILNASVVLLCLLKLSSL